MMTWFTGAYMCHSASVNSSPTLDKNGRHFTDDIFKRIFLNENVKITIQFSLKGIPKGPIDDKSALVQVMHCRLFGAKPLPEPSSPTHICDTRVKKKMTPLKQWDLLSKKQSSHPQWTPLLAQPRGIVS